MHTWCHLPTIFTIRRVLLLVALTSILVAFSTTLIFAHASHAAPGTNKTISFQGRLLSSAGAVVADGQYNIQFKIYQDGSGTAAGNPDGSLKWTETYANTGSTSGVDVKNGFFSVNLGSQTPFGTSVDWNQDTLYLSMNIAGNAAGCSTFGTAPCAADGEMLPMKRITATPYALNAGSLGGINAAGFIQNQNITAQSASSFWIDGMAKAATGLQGPSIDTITSGPLSIGTANANALTIGSSNAIATFPGKVSMNNALTIGGTLTSSQNSRLSIGGVLNSSETDSQYGAQNEVYFSPTGTALGNIYGATNVVRVSGSALNITNVYGSLNRIQTLPGYTGQITNGYGMRIDSPYLDGPGGADGRKVNNYAGLFIARANNGGNTANAVNNYGIQIQNNTATAGVGGTVRNYGIQMSLSSGGGTGTNYNYGIYLTGNGGTGATNWAIYNDSTAANYLQGNVSVGTTSNPSNYALNVAGSTNTSSQYLINGTSALTNSALNFSGATASTITSASGQSLNLNGTAGVTIQSNGTTSASFNNTNLQIGDGTSNGAPTLLTLDKAAAAPTVDSSLKGSMYYDTTLGKVQCYEADGWGACSDSPDTFVTLSPEYSNAVMNGTDIGTISSDLCSDTLNINDGSNSQPTICGTNETYNFYKWTSNETTTQTRSIYVTYQLPANFKQFVSSSTSLMARTDSTNASVNYQIYRDDQSNGLVSCGTAITASTGTQSTWQKAVASGGSDPSNCSFAAGDSILLRINLTAAKGANAYVSNLGFVFHTN